MKRNTKKPNKTQIPKKKQIIYINTSLYLSHKKNDIQNKKTTVKSMEWDSIQKIYIFTVKGNLGGEHIWNTKEQAKLKKKFGNQKAHRDPDHRPEFNDNDSGWIPFDSWHH